MNVVYHSLSSQLEEETYGYQFWVVEVINVCVFRHGHLINVPNCPSEALKTARRTRNGFDRDTEPGFIRIPSQTQLGRDYNDFVSGTSKRLAVLMKNAGIERPVYRRQLYNLDRSPTGSRSVALGTFTTWEAVSLGLLLRDYCQRRVPK